MKKLILMGAIVLGIVACKKEKKETCTTCNFYVKRKDLAGIKKDTVMLDDFNKNIKGCGEEWDAITKTKRVWYDTIINYTGEPDTIRDVIFEYSDYFECTPN